MQPANKDGTFGPITEFNPKKLTEILLEDQVSHVEVFEGTPIEMERRRKLAKEKPHHVPKQYQRITTRVKFTPKKKKRK